MTEPDAIVAIRGISKSFADRPAVCDLSLEIAPGEFFSMLGPSGCGKTTTLRALGGFVIPDAGEILLDGVDVTDVPPYRRRVNTVFQSFALFTHLSVADNVAFGLRRQRVARPEIARRVQEMLELVRLADRARAKPAELSGGQQQRVALARALVNLPKVLLLDEPLSALDLKLRREMQVELKRIQREVGTTFVFVTHDQEEAMTMSDRIAVMNEGALQQVGPPDAIYRRPANRFVAEFIGTSNLLPARGRGGALELADGLLVAPPPDGAPVADGEAVMLSIRPEQLLLGDDMRDTCVRLTAHVESAMFLGPVTHVALQTALGTRLVAIVGGSLDRPLRAGDRVDVGWRAADVWLLRDGADAAC